MKTLKCLCYKYNEHTRNERHGTKPSSNPPTKKFGRKKNTSAFKHLRKPKDVSSLLQVASQPSFNSTRMPSPYLGDMSNKCVCLVHQQLQTGNTSNWHQIWSWTNWAIKHVPTDSQIGLDCKIKHFKSTHQNQSGQIRSLLWNLEQQTCAASELYYKKESPKLSCQNCNLN